MSDIINALIVTGVILALFYLLSEPFKLSNFTRFFLGFSVALVTYALSSELSRSLKRK